MGQTLEVSPLQIEIGDTEVWFRFSDPSAAMLEIPPAFEQQLRDVIDDNRLNLEGRSVHLVPTAAPWTPRAGKPKLPKMSV